MGYINNMFGTLFSALRTQPKNDLFETKRAHERRQNDKCVVVINGKTYPVLNWSLGGLMIHADSRPFVEDNEVNVTLRFKLRNDIIDITQRARVVRKTRDRVAFQFEPLTKDIRRKFQSVIDDFVTGQFVDSQLSS